ncbi:nucleoside deaminase [Nocardia neocaledoniensis]|uniref:tRNA(Arg) A34 adenosine deaminase TadA n=1 Tax=Nocardia neocaledoniensis TaxID=236511 RepID=A0A317NJB0_9NOCA|nr:nucleoside deaminase [Nocardia neocaledoniensis]PWV75215.1 tRNA(Arg) A34 adenosine deaminase TadA [Nocardia neocaledoniensis]
MTDLTDIDRTHLRRAIDLAALAAERGDRPFGAVAVDRDGTVIAEGANAVSSTGDVTTHAELVAITVATAAGKAEDLRGATVYASGEPCPMCSAAMVWAQVGRIVFAAAAAEFGPILPGGPSFTLTCAELVASSNVPVEVSGPHLGEEALAVFRAAAAR